MTIGQRISELRRNHGYSQEYVAEQLGVSRQAVSKWETDTSAPDTYNLIGLAQLFGVSVEFIAVGKKDESGDTVDQGATTASNPIVVTNNYKHGLSIDQILGVVSMIFFLICGILSITVNDSLLPLTLILCLCTVLCFLPIKHKSIVSWWMFWGLIFLLSIFGTVTTPFGIFDPAYYREGFTVQLFWGYFVWGELIFIIIYTVRYVKKIRKATIPPD